jgi:hypothetical protein
MPARSLTSELPHASAVALLHAHVLRHLAADDWQRVHMNTIRGYDAAMHDKRWCAQVHEQPLQDSTIECPVGPIVARGVSRVCAWRHRGSSDTGSSGVSSANGPRWSWSCKCWAPATFCWRIRWEPATAATERWMRYFLNTCTNRLGVGFASDLGIGTKLSCRGLHRS